MLVVPRKHVGALYDLPDVEQASDWKLVVRVREQLMARLAPDRFNIDLNDETAAGQTVMHAHVHGDSPLEGRRGGPARRCPMGDPSQSGVLESIERRSRKRTSRSRSWSNSSVGLS
jgi:diadenosine tetraphosphate (Ap4A) HIT family hydrolase